MSQEFIQAVGISAGILTAFSMLPQLIKVIKKKEARDISVVMLLVLIGGLVMWVIYGNLKDDLPIMLTNGFSVLLNLVLLFFRFRYGKKN